MSKWKNIETAPKDRRVLLYWPNYARYDYDKGEKRIAVGKWKTVGQLITRGGGISEIAKPGVDHYFSDNDEPWDYNLALPQHRPTHWMPLPEPPK